MNADQGKQTLIDLLEYHAEHQTEKRAFIYLEGDGPTEYSLTYGELSSWAKNIAIQLLNVAARGDRALLLFPPGLDFIKAFFGCLYANLIAVPAYPPRNNRNAQRIRAIATDASVKLCLSTSTVQPRLQNMFTLIPALEKTQWILTDKMGPSNSEELKDYRINADDLAILQYTSGSTNLPRGVMVSHKNFLHNLSFSYGRWELSQDSTFVSWLPVFHDMGLVTGILLPVFGGFTGILMSPTSFLQRPFRWLHAISNYAANISIAPNFAYDLCVDKITTQERQSLDLSNWHHAINGAEPVHWHTLERFISAFHPYGFRRNAFNPGYGLAEGTLVVTVGWKAPEYRAKEIDKEALGKNRIKRSTKSDKNSIRIVGCGQGAADQQIVIVNPSARTRCPPEEVGEIWLMGPSVAQGYWGREKETEETFQAYLTDTGEGPFLRTGDLGFIDKQDLYITGRLKDLIILHGVNYYPQDIEHAVLECHSSFRKGFVAAFSVIVDESERLVVVQEVERHAKPSMNAVIENVRNRLAEDFGIHLYALVLIRNHTIPKTSSGKIQRSACKSAYEQGELKVLSEWHEEKSASPDTLNTLLSECLGKTQISSQEGADAGRLKPWLITHISKLLNIPTTDVNPKQTLTSYGLDSVLSMTLVGDLERKTDRSLPASLIFDYPTIDGLCDYLAKHSSPKRPSRHTNDDALSEPIAIIGMACRFPGANSPVEFWKLLEDGDDAITDVPPNRWDDSIFDDRDKTILKRGGFIQDIDMFDPQFFEVSVREAKSMDPQQRILLETVWEALENAGQTSKHYSGSQTGVFIGISSFDHVLTEFNALNKIDAYGGTGIAHSIAANRISYYLNLRGPSMSVDTACSSSLVAVHLACQSLRLEESSCAIAGGVNLILSPLLTYSLSKAGMLAIDGRCKTFDSKADGYVRGEGCGIVVLKRLSDALAAHDQILATIRGSAVNQDGRSSGLTAPNGPSQEAVIQQALVRARVQPNQIDYVECHGTGTPLGDPQEVQALHNVLGVNRSDNQKCIIGSTKTNIGHLEAAAGIAGLIKVVLSLIHNSIPRLVHFEHVNPHIPLTSSYFSIPTKMLDWSKKDRPRFAGISSFGFGGTNSHVLVSDAPNRSYESSALERPWHILTLSAKDDEGLKQLSMQYVNCCQLDPKDSVPNICFTASTKKTHFSHRLAVPVQSHGQIIRKLEIFNFGENDPEICVGEVKSSDAPKLAFMFSDQGAQYVGMGKQFYETQPIFREALNRCSEILDSRLDQPLLSVIYPDSDDQRSLINETTNAQPTLFALEYAMAEMLKSWGIVPDAVMGHSVGEYVAACVAGVFSLEDGLALIAERGRLMGSLSGNSKMIAVFADAETILRKILSYGNPISIAAINGPRNTIISGETAAIDAFLEHLRKERTAYREWNVSHAFHSHLMEPIMGEFDKSLAGLHQHRPRMPIISNLTGKWYTETVPENSYWRDHLRQPVQFFEGMGTLYHSGINIFFEIGPNSTLVDTGRQCLIELCRKSQPAPTLLTSLKNDEDEWRTMLNSLAALYAQGYDIDWEGFDSPYHRVFVSLPTYPFKRQRVLRTQPKESLDRLKTASKVDRIEAEVQTFSINELQKSEYQTIPTKLLTLNQLSISYITKLFIDSGIFGEQGQKYTIDEFVSQLGILPEYRKVLMIWLHILAKEKVLSFEGESVSAITPLSTDNFMVLVKKAEEVWSDEPLLPRLVNSFGGNLSHILRGDIAPLDLLFPSGSYDTAQKIYEDFSVARICNNIMVTALVAIAKGHRGQKKLRILEIGAGTGGTAMYLIPNCPPSETSYTFTDIGEGFLQHGAKKFRNYSFIDYKKLDIEKKPSVQGFDLNAYDILVAANVLHATRDVNESLEHIYALLRPGGYLILLELTESQPWLNVTFGLLEGWRRFVDSDLRPTGPLLNKDTWQSVLESANFHNVYRFPENGKLAESLGSHVFIAQKSDAGPVPTQNLRASSMAARCDRAIYEISWIPRDLTRSASETKTKPDVWIIFADSKGIADRVAELMGKIGHQPIIVRPGNSFEVIDDSQFCVGLSNYADIDRLIDRIFAMHCDTSFLGVIHMWSLDAVAKDDMTIRDFQESQKCGCENILLLVRALADSLDKAKTVKLWLITKNSQYVENCCTKIAFSQAPVWGLGKVVGLEYPGLWGGIVDLDDESTDTNAHRILQEIRHSDSEDQVAFRNNQRYVPRLNHARHPQQPDSKISLSVNGTYVITGGLGGLGIATARWMIERGARRFLILSHTQLPPRSDWNDTIREGNHLTDKLKAILEFESLGASVHLAPVDVGDEEGMLSFFRTFQREAWPPIRGVIHAAGVLQDRSLINMDRDSFRKVMHPKLYGTWLLHRCVRDCPLDFFVLFSSAASVIGSAGQGNHAAANAFLDSFAHYRQTLGLPAHSINWGPWSDIGAVAGKNLSLSLGKTGVKAIPPQVGIELLAHIMGATVAHPNRDDANTQKGKFSNSSNVAHRPKERLNQQSIVISIDWKQFADYYQGRISPMFAHLVSDHACGSKKQKEELVPQRVQRQEGRVIQPEQKQDVPNIESQIKGLVGELLMVDPSDIPNDESLDKFGFDSIMAVQLATEIEAQFNINISTKEMTQFNINRLVDQVQRLRNES